MTVSEPNYIAIRKPAGATHMRNVYTASERKAVNGCWYIVESNGFRQVEYEMSLNDLANYLGVPEIKNKDWAMSIIRGLNTKPVEWNIMGRDRTTEWGTCVFLQHGVIRGRKFYFKLSDKFLSWAKDPSVYTRLKLAYIIKFSGKHAIALTEFLTTEMDTSGRPNAKEFYLDVSLKDLKNLLNLAPSQYPRFSNLRQCVIEPAIREVNKYAEFNVDFERIDAVRKVIGLRFHIVGKERHQLDLQMPDINIARAADMDTTLIKDPSETAGELFTLLNACEIGDRKAAALIADEGPQKLFRNIAYALKDYMQGTVNKLSGYLLKAIEEDYANKWSEPKVNAILAQWRQKNNEAIALQEKRVAREVETKLKSEYIALKTSRLSEYLSAQPEGWIEEQRVFYQENSMPALVKTWFDDEGWESPMVVAAFNDFIKVQLLKRPEECSFENFQLWCTHQPEYVTL